MVNPRALRWIPALLAVGATGCDPPPAARPHDVPPRVAPPAPPVPVPPRPAYAGPRHVPNVQFDGADCAIDVEVPLVALDADVASVALVLAPHAGPPDGLVRMACGAGRVVREVGRAAFDAAARQGLTGHATALALRVAAPDVACGVTYAALTCVRDRAGRLDAGPDAWAHTVTARRDGLVGPVVATPSGEEAAWRLEAGAVVLSYDARAPGLVEARVLATREGARRPAVALDLEDGRTVVVPGERRYAVAGAFRDADALAPGDVLVDVRRGAAVVRARRPAGPDERPRAVALDVAWPDAYFEDGLLVGDDGRRASPPPAAPSVFAPTREAVAVTPAPMSWDCQLAARLDVTALAPGVASLAVVAARHPGPPGARVPLACDRGGVVAELSRAVLDAARAETAYRAGAAFALTLSGGPIRCDGRYAVVACARDAAGALALAAPGALGRFGRAGPVCLAAGTPVDTPSGSVAIERLVAGQAVLAYDLAAGRVATARVVRLVARAGRTVATFTLADGSALRATEEHPVYVPRAGAFRPARAVAAGDELLRRDGTRVAVRARTAFAEPAVVYDLTVDGPRNYFAAGVLVHNY